MKPELRLEQEVDGMQTQPDVTSESHALLPLCGLPDLFIDVGARHWVLTPGIPIEYHDELVNFE